MELLFITIGGAIIGLIARYALPHRHTQGSVLIPAIGAGAAAAIWVALTWAGLAWNGGFIWWITLVATALVSVAVALVVGAVRTRSDDRLLHTLQHGTPLPAR